MGRHKKVNKEHIPIIIKMYKNHVGSTAISRKLGYTPTTILKIVGRAGVPIKNHRTKQKSRYKLIEKEIISLYKTGKETYESLSKRFNCTVGSVRSVIYHSSSFPNLRRSYLRDRGYGFNTWSKKVKIKYKHKCYICGSSRGLRSHHILSWMQYPKMRFKVLNGVCLCDKHHDNSIKGSLHNLYGDAPSLKDLKEYIKLNSKTV